MKRAIVISAFAAVACVGSAAIVFALPTATTTVPLNGTAQNICSFTSKPEEGSTPGNMELTSASPSASTVTITELIDPATAHLLPAFIQLVYSARCNRAHTVSLTTQKDGLTDDSPTPVTAGEFLQRINYDASVIWTPQALDFTTDGTEPGRTETGYNANPKDGKLKLDIAINSSNNDLTKPVVAGYYTDTLTVHIGEPW